MRLSAAQMQGERQDDGQSGKLKRKNKQEKCYEQEFIKFLAECGVLKFGTFTLKSGRIAPYFLNAGEYKTGAQIKRLGEFYAACIREHGVEAETLFGPAYKGIPLALSAAVALYEKYGADVNFCFDRKEVKDHGEGGMFVEKALGSEQSAVQQAYAEEGVKVYSIVTIEDIIEALEQGVIEGKEHVPAIREYLKQYGAKY